MKAARYSHDLLLSETHEPPRSGWDVHVEWLSRRDRAAEFASQVEHLLANVGLQPMAPPEVHALPEMGVSLLGYGEIGAEAVRQLRTSPFLSSPPRGQKRTFQRSKLVTGSPSAEKEWEMCLRDPVRFVLCDGGDARAVAAAEQAVHLLAEPGQSATVLLVTGDWMEAEFHQRRPWLAGVSRLVIPWGYPHDRACIDALLLATLVEVTATTVASLITRAHYVHPGSEAPWLLACGPSGGGFGAAVPFAGFSDSRGEAGRRAGFSFAGALDQAERLLGFTEPGVCEPLRYHSRRPRAATGGWRLTIGAPVGSDEAHGALFNLDRADVSCCLVEYDPSEDVRDVGVILLCSGGGSDLETYAWSIK